MSETTHFVVSANEGGARLDVLVAQHLSSISRSLVQAMVREGDVTINGLEAKASRKVVAGDVVDVRVSIPPSLTAKPEEIPLCIVYQDEDLAIVDKPAGLVVHPAPGHPGGTVANAIAALFPSTSRGESDVRPGIVHRLDKDTSGLMVVALSAFAQGSLQAQIAAHTARRQYLALASGEVRPTRGVIDAPIGRDQGDRLRMAVFGESSRQARTRYEVLERLPAFTLLHATLETGRTHQIRVHFAALGHPLAGDAVYGGPQVKGLSRQFLHASELTLVSPSTGKELCFTSPLPQDLQDVLHNVRGSR